MFAAFLNCFGVMLIIVGAVWLNLVRGVKLMMLGLMLG